MQNDMMGYCWSLLISIIMICQVQVFIAASPVAMSAHRSTTGGVDALKDATDVYSLASAQFMMDAVPSGKVSFKPHDLDEVNERPVYDPGDELLRALNADIAASGQELGTLPMEPDYADTVYNELEIASKYEMMRKLQNDLQDEQDIVSKSTILLKMLEDPSIDTLPIVYVEDEAAIEDDNNDDNNKFGISLNSNGMAKRSRYYRRYPWKRHNRNRSTYEPELRYACTPTKEDVFKLLKTIHENRNGKNGKTVSFCNRKRPAKAIFTNIRFLG